MWRVKKLTPSQAAQLWDMLDRTPQALPRAIEFQQDWPLIPYIGSIADGDSLDRLACIAEFLAQWSQSVTGFAAQQKQNQKRKSK